MQGEKCHIGHESRICYLRFRDFIHWGINVSTVLQGRMTRKDNSRFEVVEKIPRALASTGDGDINQMSRVLPIYMRNRCKSPTDPSNKTMVHRIKKLLTSLRTIVRTTQTLSNTLARQLCAPFGSSLHNVEGST